MPKILVFVPCLKTIFDQDDDSISLVSLIQRLTITRPPGGIPPRAVSANDWSVLALWDRLPEDAGKTFEMAFQIMMPDGTPHSGFTRQFRMDTQTYRMGGNIHGFPISQEGVYILVLGLRDVTGSAIYKTVAEYPVHVRHVDPAPERSPASIIN